MTQKDKPKCWTRKKNSGENYTNCKKTVIITNPKKKTAPIEPDKVIIKKKKKVKKIDRPVITVRDLMSAKRKIALGGVKKRMNENKTKMSPIDRTLASIQSSINDKRTMTSILNDFIYKL